MKQVITKQTQSIVYGDSDYARFIFVRLKDKVKDTILLGHADELRFIETNIASVNGVKTRFKKALVELPSNHNPVQTNSTKSVVIVGSDPYSVSNVLTYIGTAESITLIIHGNNLLPTHDSAVQDVMQRYFKKMKIKLHFETDVLSVLVKDHKHYTIAEHKGQPKRFASDALITEPTQVIVDFGLENTKPVNNDHNSDKSCSLNKNIGLLKTDQPLSLADVDTIVEFMSGSKNSFVINTPYTQIHSSGGVSFFSIGLTEQSVTSAHTGYRKSIIKLPGIHPDSPTYFIKILASISGRLLGISGITKEDTLDLDLLYHFVAVKVRVLDAKKALSVTTPYAASLHEALDSL